MSNCFISEVVEIPRWYFLHSSNISPKSTDGSIAVVVMAAPSLSTKDEFCAEGAVDSWLELVAVSSDI